MENVSAEKEETVKRCRLSAMGVSTGRDGGEALEFEGRGGDGRLGMGLRRTSGLFLLRFFHCLGLVFFSHFFQSSIPELIPNHLSHGVAR